MVVKGFATSEVTAGGRTKGHAAASRGLCELEFRMRSGCDVRSAASCSAIVQDIKDGGFAERMSKVWRADHVRLQSYGRRGSEKSSSTGAPPAAMATTPDCGAAGADLRASRGMELRGAWIAASSVLPTSAGVVGDTQYKFVSWYKWARSDCLQAPE
eukprot:3285486-Rhodomonas_salina.1